MGSYCLMGVGVSVWGDEKDSGGEQWSQLHNSVNILNST